jgi:BlaI family transcriptional regulator, penicillinase repressor
MVRPQQTELTERELEVMHIFWQGDEMTAATAREVLASRGIDRAYVTIANLVRILVDKGFLEATNDERPFLYRPRRSFDDVSRKFVTDLVKRVFRGSREQLLMKLLDGRGKLSVKERALLKQILKEQES